MTKPAVALSETQSADAMLRARAQRVIPGGMYGHLNVARLPEGYPQFFAPAEGCRVRDVDGNDYVDFMCSWGPVVLGHGTREVEAAADAQRALGDCLTARRGHGRAGREARRHGGACRLGDVPEERHATPPRACVTIARAGTGTAQDPGGAAAPITARRPGARRIAGVTTEDRAHLVHYEYNDVASLQAAVDEAGKDLAAIVVSALPPRLSARTRSCRRAEFAAAARAACDADGAALILDDVRAGFRLDLGGSWETVGVRPDLAAWSKAIANGYALAAVTGNDKFRDAATKVFITGSFWCGAVSMAAARTTLRDRARNRRARPYPRHGPAAARGPGGAGEAARHRAPPERPAADADCAVRRRSGRREGPAVLFGGAARWRILPSAHNMFLSSAHQPADIDAALEAASHGFKAVRAIS